MMLRVVFLLVCLAVCQAFIGSGDDQYMKKFAYRKVYESCFGPAVVKQIRREKHEAIAKCRRQAAGSPSPAGGQTGQGPSPSQSDGPEPRPEVAHSHPEATQPRPEVGLPIGMLNHFPAKKRPSVQVGTQGSSFDHTKLQELFGLKSQSGYIQAQRHPLQPHQQLQHQQQSNNPTHQPYHPFGYPGSHFSHPTASFPQPFPQQYPIQQYPGEQFSGQPFSIQQYPGSQQFSGDQNFGSAPLVYPFSALKAFYPQQGYSYPQAIYAQSSFFPFGVFENTRKRGSRNLSIQSQLDSLNRAIGAKAENVSCHLQELGYLDDNLEPDYEQISERVRRLPIEEELKRDMLDGLEFCKRFSQCMPDMRREESKLPKDQDKQMFFFSCYKHKKLEACLMKDVRERFMTDDPLTSDELTADDLRSLPRARKAKMPDFSQEPESAKSYDDVFFYDDDDVYFV